PDERSWAAVEAARAFARGEITSATLSAARAAAWDARDARDARAAAAAGAAAAWAAAAWAAAAWAAAAEAAAAAAAARGAETAIRAATAAWYAAQDAQYRRLCAYLEGAPIPPVKPLYGTYRLVPVESPKENE